MYDVRRPPCNRCYLWSILNSNVYFYSIENHEYLKKFLIELSNPAHSSKITDWHYGGQVFLDYINQCEAVDRFIKALRGEEVSSIIYKSHIYPVYWKGHLTSIYLEGESL
jgi:hypothetical protein